MKRIVRVVILVMIYFLTHEAKAQKKPYYKTEKLVVSAVAKTFDTESETGNLRKWVSKNNIKGSYVMDITIGGKKSEVVTVMSVESGDEATINHQNKLKNYIKKMRMPFKIPKGESYKIQYEFNF